MKATLTLHRKIDSRRECICGDKLGYVNGHWICPTQYRKKEPSRISLERDKRYTIKRAEEIILYYLPK